MTVGKATGWMTDALYHQRAKIFWDFAQKTDDLFALFSFEDERISLRISLALGKCGWPGHRGHRCVTLPERSDVVLGLIRQQTIRSRRASGGPVLSSLVAFEETAPQLTTKPVVLRQVQTCEAAPLNEVQKPSRSCSGPGR